MNSKNEKKDLNLKKYGSFNKELFKDATVKNALQSISGQVNIQDKEISFNQTTMQIIEMQKMVLNVLYILQNLKTISGTNMELKENLKFQFAKFQNLNQKLSVLINDINKDDKNIKDIINDIRDMRLDIIHINSRRAYLTYFLRSVENYEDISGKEDILLELTMGVSNTYKKLLTWADSMKFNYNKKENKDLVK